MSLKDRLTSAKRGLKSTVTKITRVDGSMWTEVREGQSCTILHREEQSSHGFVPDLKPDFQMARVMDGLFVGSQDVASECTILDDHNVTHLINAGVDIENTFPQKYNYLTIPLLDCPNVDVLAVFPKCNQFIDEARRNAGTVFVHCNAGVSRSITIVMAYLMYKTGITCVEALTNVRKTRPSAKPNEGFMRQLESYEKALTDNKF